MLSTSNGFIVYSIKPKYFISRSWYTSPSGWTLLCISTQWREFWRWHFVGVRCSRNHCLPCVLWILFTVLELECLLNFFPLLWPGVEGALLLSFDLDLCFEKDLSSLGSALNVEWGRSSCWKIISSTWSSLVTTWRWWFLSLTLSSLFLPRRVTAARWREATLDLAAEKYFTLNVGHISYRGTINVKHNIKTAIECWDLSKWMKTKKMRRYNLRDETVLWCWDQLCTFLIWEWSWCRLHLQVTGHSDTLISSVSSPGEPTKN